MSISDLGKTVNKVNDLWKGSDKKSKRFGVGGPSEQSCQSFRAFLECRGYVHSQKKAVDLPPDSTLEDARLKFGRRMRQQKILDEDGYELDANWPVWRYSKDCNISLVFAYDTGEELDHAAIAVREKAASAQNAFGTLWGTIFSRR